MKTEIFIMFVGFMVVSTVSVFIHISLKLIRINRWVIPFPLASLICYFIFCLWFVGRPYPLHLEGHDFGIISSFGGPITFIIPAFPDWLGLYFINMILPFLIAFQYLLFGWLIDKFEKIINNRKTDKRLTI